MVSFLSVVYILYLNVLEFCFYCLFLTFPSSYLVFIMMKDTEGRKHYHFIDYDAWVQLLPDFSVLCYMFFAFLFVYCLRALCLL